MFNIVADAFWDPSWYLDYYIEFHVHNRQTSSPVVLTYGDELTLLFSPFKKKPGTVMYIHGWMGQQNTESAQMIRDAYLKFMDCNVILVDWSTTAQQDYFTAAKSISEIGKRIAEMIKWLVRKNRIDIADLHIIGFSLGAHVAGFTGKALAPLKVRRITGLDPAGPGFELNPPHKRLDKSDAKFVDVIHSDTTWLGIDLPIGHVDFYPDWGHKQKDCGPIDIPCSHMRANEFYAKSITNPARFIGVRCDLYDKTLTNCRKEGITVLGYAANPRVHGVFLILSQY
ncbi:hypothetical protein PV327_004674 [Microctonus hyperodae]|uniref:phospholipase A1 n=1 Tax=Microctonus hyperodae TaxID=165561 RepID=A0AA39FCX2_MICHY|nr:hypothetical protein PV327_004674 [Microctonus hyperodae]